MSQFGDQSFLGPAKPFNVINPSGVSANASVGALTSMKNQASENSTRMALGQQQMAAQQQQAEAEMQFQAQEAEKDRKLQESRYKDETFFRLRTEELSKLYQDHQAEKERIDENYRVAVLADDEVGISEWAAQKADIESRTRAIAKNLVGLKTLKQGRDGLFNKDFKGPEGKGNGSMGAQFIESLVSSESAKQQQFNRTVGDLDPVLARLRAVDTAKKEQPKGLLARGFLASEGIKAVNGAAPSATNALVDDMAEMGSTVTSNLYGLTGDPLTLDQFQDPTPAGGTWDELATTLASTVVGGTGSKGGTGTDVQVGLKSFFESLEKSVDAQGDLKSAFLKQAAEQYKGLEAKGADVRLLDRILYRVFDTTGKGVQASKAMIAQAGAEAAASGATPLSMKGGGDSWDRLNKMLVLAQTLQDPAAGGMTPEGGSPPISTRLLKGWNDDQMGMYAPGTEGAWSMEKMILDTVSVLADASDPADLMRRLVNDDPNDDPEQLSFISTLDPGVRTILVRQLSKGLMALEDEMGIAKEYGIESTVDLQGQISSLKRKESEALDEYQQKEQRVGNRKGKVREKAERERREQLNSETKKYREQREAIPSHPYDKKEEDEAFPKRARSY